MTTRGAREAGRDRSAPTHTVCGTHGIPLDEHRRCSECRAEAVSDFEQDDED